MRIRPWHHGRITLRTRLDVKRRTQIRQSKASPTSVATPGEPQMRPALREQASDVTRQAGKDCSESPVHLEQARDPASKECPESVTVLPCPTRATRNEPVVSHWASLARHGGYPAPNAGRRSGTVRASARKHIFEPAVLELGFRSWWPRYLSTLGGPPRTLKSGRRRGPRRRSLG